MFDDLKDPTYKSEQSEKKPRRRLQIRLPFRIVRKIERVYLVSVFVRDAEGKEYTIPVPKFLESHRLKKRGLKEKIKRRFIRAFSKEET